MIMKTQRLSGTRNAPLSIPEGTRLTGKLGIYEVTGALGADKTGASGTVLKCKDGKGAFVAVKLYVHQGLENQIQSATGGSGGLFSQDSVGGLLDEAALNISQKEQRALSALQDPGIVKLLDTGTIAVPSSWFPERPLPIGSVPFSVLQLIDGPRMEEWLAKGQTWHAVLRLIQSVCSALRHMHACQILHGDIKLDNVRMDQDGYPHLMDFGSAIFFDDLSNVEQYFDVPEARINSRSKHYQSLITARRNKGNASDHKALCFPWFDIMCLAEMLLHAGVNDTPGLPNNVKATLKSTLEDVVVDTPAIAPSAEHFEYLVCKSETPDVISFLIAGRVERSIPLTTGIVPLRSPADGILDVPEFARLHEVKQLGLVEQVYRGATHTRFYHSVATYNMMQQMLTQLLATRDPLFSKVWTPQLGQLALCTALLHDLHHFHFLHVFEEGRLFQDREAVRDFKEEYFVRLCKGVRAPDVLEGNDVSICDVLSEARLSPLSVLAVLRGYYDLSWKKKFPDLWKVDHPKGDSEHPFSNESLKMLHALIDSGTDVDKLAYLTEDAYFAGTSFGRVVDVPMILKYACIERDPSGEVALAYREQAVPAIESLLLARHWSFKTMYWHHTHRALMAMILNVVDTTFENLDDMKEFILRTSYSSQSDFLRMLDAEFQKRSENGSHSILFGLPFRRKLLYKRLCSLRPFPETRLEARLGMRLREWLGDVSKRQSRINDLVAAVSEVLRPLLIMNEGQVAALESRDILVDFAGRKIDNVGSTYISSSGELKSIEEWSASVHGLGSQFDKLSKYVRVFVNPASLRDWTSVRRDEYHERILGCLNQVVPE
jgi:HD superfamily phosphohydrolase/serine/threonine protein kinase